MIEGYVLERIGSRLQEFMAKGGRSLLERIVQEEVEPKNGSAEEIDRVRLTLGAIRQKIDTLLDSLTPTNKEFIDEKLRMLKAERDRLEARLIALDAPRQHAD